MRGLGLRKLRGSRMVALRLWGSVATYLMCGKIFKYDFVADLSMSLSVKEFWKSVNIWRSYGQEFSVFLAHGAGDKSANRVTETNASMSVKCRRRKPRRALLLLELLTDIQSRDSYGLFTAQELNRTELQCANFSVNGRIGFTQVLNEN